MMASRFVRQGETLHGNRTASSFTVGISILFLRRAKKEAKNFPESDF